MRGVIGSLGTLAILALAGTACTPAPGPGQSTVQGLSADSVKGRWCASEGVYTISSTQLTITPTGEKAFVLPIQAIEVMGSTVRVRWIRENSPSDPRITDFAEIKGDTMVQLGDAGSNVPRRNFKRC